jgi:flagellar biosynthesis/type III secretory pathway protein FliH
MAAFTPTLRFARRDEAPSGEPDAAGDVRPAADADPLQGAESFRATALTKRRAEADAVRFDSLGGWGSAPPPPPDATETAPAPEADPAYVEEMLEAARRAGRAEAMAELRPEIEQLERTLATLGPALESIATLRRQALEQAADDVGGIIRAVCGRVLDEAFSTQPSALARIITDAVSQLPEAEDVQIAVPPGMLEHVARAIDPRFRACVVPDDTIGNGCVVRTRYVTLDATLEAALAGVDAAVHEWIGLQPWSAGSL